MEYTAKSESTAKAMRRYIIGYGHEVTLIGYDSSRDLYAFNCLTCGQLEEQEQEQEQRADWDAGDSTCNCSNPYCQV